MKNNASLSASLESLNQQPKIQSGDDKSDRPINTLKPTQIHKLFYNLAIARKHH
jgi:hypothetical protein